MKTWIVSSLDEETIQGEETIWGNTVNIPDWYFFQCRQQNLLKRSKMNMPNFWKIAFKKQQRLQEINPEAISHQKRKMTRISLILELLTFFPQVAKSQTILSHLWRPRILCTNFLAYEFSCILWPLTTLLIWSMWIFSGLKICMSQEPDSTHWFFLEIFVWKFKCGNQQVLVQNWVKNVVINKCSLSKNLKNGPKLQL